MRTLHLNLETLAKRWPGYGCLRRWFGVAMADSSLYLIRIWRRVGAFRATVRPVPDAEARWFIDPRAVVDFLVIDARPECWDDAGERRQP